VQLNNGTWDQLDSGVVGTDSTAELKEGLLYAAYACTYHWMQVGTPINHARGEHLISRVSLRIGRRDQAFHHARRCHELLTQHVAEAEDWDWAFAYEALARASAASGDLERGRAYLREAEERGQAIAAAEDREAFLAELGKGEWFGLRETT
jgi:hypothetical protein